MGNKPAPQPLGDPIYEVDRLVAITDVSIY